MKDSLALEWEMVFLDFANVLCGWIRLVEFIGNLTNGIHQVARAHDQLEFVNRTVICHIYLAPQSGHFGSGDCRLKDLVNVLLL